MVRRSDAARLLPTTVVHFTPEDNNTHSRLELAFTDVLPKKLTKLSFSGGHFALNYTKMSDRALIEIPIEISKTVRTINDELPPLLNFTLFFWCMQVRNANVGGLVPAWSFSVRLALLLFFSSHLICHIIFSPNHRHPTPHAPLSFRSWSWPVCTYRASTPTRCSWLQ